MMSQSRTRDKASHDADLELIRAASSGERKAVRALADRILDRVRTTVRVLVPRDRDADDLVQNSVLEILRSASSFRGDSRLETWADRITVRTIKHALHRRSRRERLLVAERSPSAAVPHQQEADVSRSRVRARLTRAVQDLPPKQRIVVTLRYVHCHNLAEIAEITGARLNTVRGRLRGGKTRLRRAILRDPELCEWARKGEE